MMRLHFEVGDKKRKSLSTSQAGHSLSTPGTESIFEEEEVNMIDGALKYREMEVAEVMTPVEQTYMIGVFEKLSYKIIYEIFKSGFSRIPVYEKDYDDVVGLILAKDLIFIDPEVSFSRYFLLCC